MSDSSFSLPNWRRRDVLLDCLVDLHESTYIKILFMIKPLSVHHACKGNQFSRLLVCIKYVLTIY